MNTEYRDGICPELSGGSVMDAREKNSTTVANHNSSDTAAAMLNRRRRTPGSYRKSLGDEDLVEVMAAMGAKPGDTVRLKLRTLDTHELVTLKDVRMASENRWAIWRQRNGVPATQASPTTAPAVRVG